MLPYKYFVLTAIFFFVGNTLTGFFKNLFIESEDIGKELLTNVRLSYISIVAFLVFGCIANAELGDALFAGSGDLTLFAGVVLLSTLLCGFFLFLTILFSLAIFLTKLSEKEESTEGTEY